MTALAVPDLRLHPSWAAALRDFGSGYPHGSGIDPRQETDLSEAGCAAFVAERLRYSEPDVVLPAGRVPCTYFWILDDDPHDPVVGFLAVRHRLNDFLLEEGGHIGYSVRPTRRRRGHAGRALRLGLDHAAALGIEHALLTCETGNTASRRTIEAAGGRYDDTRRGRQRFWIDIREPAGLRSDRPGIAPARG